jgi:exonuclease III
VIVCGDINIAHKEIDLKNWRSNQKNSGFLPHERAWMTDLVDSTAGSTCSAAWTRARAVHVVEQSRRQLGQERRVAHRLPDRHTPRHRRQGQGGSAST